MMQDPNMMAQASRHDSKTCSNSQLCFCSVSPHDKRSYRFQCMTECVSLAKSLCCFQHRGTADDAESTGNGPIATNESWMQGAVELFKMDQLSLAGMSRAVRFFNWSKDGQWWYGWYGWLWTLDEAMRNGSSVKIDLLFTWKVQAVAFR